MNRQRSESPGGYSQSKYRDCYEWKQALHVPEAVADTDALQVVLLEQVRISPVEGHEHPSILLLAGARKKVQLSGRLVVEKGSDGYKLLKKWKSKKHGDNLNGCTVLVDEIHDYSIAIDPVTLWFRTSDSPWFEVEPSDEYRYTYQCQADVIQLYYTAVVFYEDLSRKGRRHLENMCRETGFQMPVQPWFNHDICLMEVKSRDPTDVDIIIKLFIGRTNGMGMTTNDILYLVAEYATWFVAKFNLRRDSKKDKGSSIDWSKSSFLAWIKHIGETWKDFTRFEREISARKLTRERAWHLYCSTHLNQKARQPPSRPVRASAQTSFTSFITFKDPPDDSESEFESEPEEEILVDSQDDGILGTDTSPLASIETSKSKQQQHSLKPWCHPYHGAYISPQYPNGIQPGHTNLDSILAIIYAARIPSPAFNNEPRCPDADLTFNHLLDMYYRDFSTTWRDTFKALLCRYGSRIRDSIKKQGLVKTTLYEELEPKGLRDVYEGIKDRYKADADEFSIDGVSDKKVMSHRNPSKFQGKRNRDKNERMALTNRPKSKPLSRVSMNRTAVQLPASRPTSISDDGTRRDSDGFGDEDSDFDVEMWDGSGEGGAKVESSRSELKNRDPRKMSRERRRSVENDYGAGRGGETQGNGVKRIKRIYSGY